MKITTDEGIKELMGLLESESRHDLAIEAYNVYKSCSSGTELTMGIKFVLGKLELDKISDISRKRIMNLLDYLNSKGRK